MKIIFAALALTSVVSTTSFAATKPAPIALMKTSGGFCANQCPTTTLIIQDNGVVVAQTEVTIPAPKITKVQVATLNKVIVAKIKKDVAGITTETLVDSQADAPSCADVPDKSFVVLKDDASIEIGREINCHSYFLESYKGSDLIAVLKNLAGLYNYSRI